MAKNSLSAWAFVQQKPFTPPPICLLYGEDTQLLEECRNAVRSRFAAADRHRVDIEKLAESPVAESKGLFGGKSGELFEFVGYGTPSKEALPILLETANRLQPPDILLIIFHNLNYKHFKAAWFKQVSGVADAVHAERLTAGQALPWIKFWLKENKKGDDNRSIADFDKAIQINPEDENAYYSRGFAKSKKGAYDEAIMDFNKAIQINPKHENAYCFRGFAKSKKGAYDEAIMDFDKVIQINPKHKDAHYYRNCVREGFDKAIEINPQNDLDMQDDAVELLAAQSEGNLLAAKQAIRKLSLAVGGDEPITAELVRAALSDGAQYDVFDLTNALLDGKGSRALTVLRQLRADGVAEPFLLWSIGDILNNVAMIHGGESPRVWGEGAGERMRKLRALARRLDEKHLYHLLRQSAFTDRVIKGVAGGDMETALMRLSINLAAIQRGVKIRHPEYLP